MYSRLFLSRYDLLNNFNPQMYEQMDYHLTILVFFIVIINTIIFMFFPEIMSSVTKKRKHRLHSKIYT